MSDQNQLKQKSAALQRHVQAYPPPKYFGLILAMAKCDAISKSEVINIAVKQYFDNLPQDEKTRIIQQSKNTY